MVSTDIEVAEIINDLFYFSFMSFYYFLNNKNLRSIIKVLK